ncbi:MAG: hypothetical protein ACKOGH_14165, partial [Alphaproteobacteria bacterium]
MPIDARARAIAFVLCALPAAVLLTAPLPARAQVAATACAGDFEAALATLVALPPAAMTPVDAYNAAWLRRMLGDPALLPAAVPVLEGEVTGACSGRRLAARLAELWPGFAGGSLASEPIRVVALERAVAEAASAAPPPVAPPPAP